MDMKNPRLMWYQFLSYTFENEIIVCQFFSLVRYLNLSLWERWCLSWHSQCNLIDNNFTFQCRRICLQIFCSYYSTYFCIFWCENKSFFFFKCGCFFPGSSRTRNKCFQLGRTISADYFFRLKGGKYCRFGMLRKLPSFSANFGSRMIYFWSISMLYIFQILVCMHHLGRKYRVARKNVPRKKWNKIISCKQGVN